MIDIDRFSREIFDFSTDKWIVHVDEERGYLVQHNGKKSLFVHQLDRLSKTPEIGENVKVSYPKDQEQKATVETVERQRSRSARR